MSGRPGFFVCDICALCGHDPACGVAGAPRDIDSKLVRLCHADDHSCYHRWTVYGERGGSGMRSPERAGREGDTQPMPTPNANPPIHDLVAADIAADLEARKQLGIRRYGAPLQAQNGRDSLQDAYEEGLDMVVYLKTELENRRLANGS